MDCVTITKLPPVHLSPPLICSQCIFFPKQSFFPKTECTQAPINASTNVLTFPSSYVTGGLDFMPQDLVLSRLALGSIKPFFQETFDCELFCLTFSKYIIAMFYFLRKNIGAKILITN